MDSFIDIVANIPESINSELVVIKIEKIDDKFTTSDKNERQAGPISDIAADITKPITSELVVVDIEKIDEAFVTSDINDRVSVTSNSGMHDNATAAAPLNPPEFLYTTGEQPITRNHNTRVYSLWRHQNRPEIEKRAINFFQADEDKLPEYETYHYTQVYQKHLHIAHFKQQLIILVLK